MNEPQRKIYRRLIDEIVNGELKPGDKIPPEFSLAETFCTNRMNAHYAIQHLVKKSVLEGRRKAGTVVTRQVTPALARELRNEVAQRVCVLSSQSDFERLYWDEKFESGLKGALKAEGLRLDKISMRGVATRADLERELKKLDAEGMSALLLSVRNPADRVMTDNGDLIFQYNKNVFVYQSGAEDWAASPFNTVTVNLFGEGRLAGELLVGLGCKKIAYCTPFDENACALPWAQERFKGLRYELARASDGASEPELWGGMETIKRKLFEGGMEHALVGANDFYAATIIAELGKSGLKAGSDYKIVGFDDNADFRSFKLTTIAPPHRETGRILGEMIVRHSAISANRGFTEHLKVDSVLVRRKTA